MPILFIQPETLSSICSTTTVRAMDEDVLGTADGNNSPDLFPSSRFARALRTTRRRYFSEKKVGYRTTKRKRYNQPFRDVVTLNMFVCVCVCVISRFDVPPFFCSKISSLLYLELPAEPPDPIP